jgi:hypothetical protein
MRIHESQVMRMRDGFRIAILCGASVFCASFFTGAQETSGAATAVVIACRAMEVHASAEPAVVTAVFHQQNKADQEQLGELLKAHSGETAEIQMAGGAWTRVTIFRLRSCFGRGLLIAPAGAAQIKDGTTFLLRFAGDGGEKH